LHKRIVDTFYRHILTRKESKVIHMLSVNPILSNLADEHGKTPLLAAVEAESRRVVAILLEHDADVNKFGIVGSEWRHSFSSPRAYQENILRTPLQQAAYLDIYPIVKLLMEQWQADDSLIAPDGQHALRLAAEGGHRDIVEYLPKRRGGGWRRWKRAHDKAIGRVARAMWDLGGVVKLLVWNLPRYLFYELPMTMWHSRDQVWRDLKNSIIETPKWLLRRIRKLPQGLWNSVKSVAKWVWDGCETVAKGIINIVKRFFSVLHTAFEAVVSFLRTATLDDIWHGLKDLVRAIFVTLPVKLWHWMGKIIRVSFDVMESMLGTAGWITWMIVVISVSSMVWVLTQIWSIPRGIGGLIGKAFREIWLWFDPK
ncbi:ankyrin, partial [Aulographum hederae CBS 113979]